MQFITARQRERFESKITRRLAESRAKLSYAKVAFSSVPVLIADAASMNNQIQNCASYYVAAPQTQSPATPGRRRVTYFDVNNAAERFIHLNSTNGDSTNDRLLKHRLENSCTALPATRHHLGTNLK